MSPADHEGLPSGAQSEQPVDSLDELRDILLRQDEGYLTDTVQSVLDDALSQRIQESRDEMAAVLAPVMGEAIRTQVRDAQDDIVDALYPVIGRTIQRSVTEAMRALAERVDQGLRNTFSLRRLSRRVEARVRGIPESELLLRDALPFQIQEVFLIHRASGLLLEHVSRDPDGDSDRDLVSSMLTAISDFAQDTFGTDTKGELDEIQYGDLSILVEPGSWSYMAVVVEGYAPEGIGHEIRTILSDVNLSYSSVLKDFDGDPESLAGIKERLLPLLSYQGVEEEHAATRRPPTLAIAGVSALLVACVTLACLGAWRLTWGRPEPTSTATPTATLSPTATVTHTPTAIDTPTTTPTRTPTSTSTPTPTSTPSPSPTHTAIATLTPTNSPTPTPAPVLGVMIGNVWLRKRPTDGSTTIGLKVDRARTVEILAVYDTWYLIRWPPGDDSATAGWVPGRWVGVVAPPPPRIITPVP